MILNDYPRFDSSRPHAHELIRKLIATRQLCNFVRQHEMAGYCGIGTR